VTTTIYVSVNKSLDPDSDFPFTAEQLAPYAAEAWDEPLSAAENVDHLVAVQAGRPRAAWLVRAAYKIPFGQDEQIHKEDKYRVGFALGPVLPLSDEFFDVPELQQGSSIVTRPPTHSPSSEGNADWPPVWFGAGAAKTANVSECVDELLESEGFGRDDSAL
jgi:hypothetical protein